MDDKNRSEEPADYWELDGAVAWEEFESRLADYLQTMTDSEDGDHLRLETPGPEAPEEGTWPYAQLAGFDGRRIRGEVPGNRYLTDEFRLGVEQAEALVALGFERELGDGDGGNWVQEVELEAAPSLASRVVCALRDVYGIPHPGLMTRRAWGPAATDVATLGLVETGGMTAADRDTAAVSADSAVLTPQSHDELVEMVSAVLSDFLDGEPELDEDGDFVMEHMGQLVWVMVRYNQPAVTIMARLAHAVHSRRATAVELSLLNRDNMWVKWVLRDRTIWQVLTLPAWPFVPGHLASMLELFLEAMSETRDDLALRTGAKVA